MYAVIKMLMKQFQWVLSLKRIYKIVYNTSLCIHIHHYNDKNDINKKARWIYKNVYKNYLVICFLYFEKYSSQHVNMANVSVDYLSN